VSSPRFARRVPRSQRLDTGLRASAHIQLFRECHFQSEQLPQKHTGLCAPARRLVFITNLFEFSMVRAVRLPFGSKTFVPKRQ
jgi:hypothetical protein